MSNPTGAYSVWRRSAPSGRSASNCSDRYREVEGAFGRVVDPLVDKVLVLGSFIFFAGKNFIIADTARQLDPTKVVKTVSGVAPGIVVILLTRELLVTSIRGTSEGGGQAFGAAFSGKLKMVFQSATILVILVYVNYLDRLDLRGYPQAKYVGAICRDVCIWATVAITVVSGLLYIRRAMNLYRESEATAAAGRPVPPAVTSTSTTHAG